MTATRPRRLAPVPPEGPGAAPRMTEADLDRNVKQLAAWLKLYAYHTRDSRGSARGFPDWVICGPAGILYREHKSDTGTLTVDQKAWGEALTGARANWSVWRPGDWYSGRIRRELEAIARPDEDDPGDQAELVAQHRMPLDDAP